MKKAQDCFYLTMNGLLNESIINSILLSNCYNMNAYQKI